MKVYHPVPDDVLKLSLPELQAYVEDVMKNSTEWRMMGGKDGDPAFCRIAKGSRVWLIEKNGKHFIYCDAAVPLSGGTA